MEAFSFTAVLAKDAKFERHPESLTPRIFVTVWNGDKLQYLELLSSCLAVVWPRLPYVNELKETYWAVRVSKLDDLNIHHAKSDTPKQPELGDEVWNALEDAGMKIVDGEPVPVEAQIP